MSWRRFSDWPLRRKMLTLLLLASTIPVLLATGLALLEARARGRQQAILLLEARADQLRGELDAFHRRYEGLVSHLSRIVVGAPPARAGAGPSLDGWRTAIESVMRAGPEVRAALVTDETGRVLASTQEGSQGMDLSFRAYVREALAGSNYISDIFLSLAVGEQSPLIAYSGPLRDPSGAVLGSVALFVRATAFWELVRSLNERAGAGSYALVLDRFGVRQAHGLRGDLVFHPTGTLPPAEIERMVKERRFDVRTRELLSQPLNVPDQFNMARANWLPEKSQHAQRYIAVANNTWNLSVARRLDRVPWTVFVLVPERSVYASADPILRTGIGASAVVATLALMLGLWLSSRILRPLQALSAAADGVARGELTTRVAVRTGDELGTLADRFNQMASNLQSAHEGLETRVRERTIELEHANEELKAQREELITQRGELQAQQRELEIKSEQALRADRLKSEFLANMSHELRTPLNSIIGFSELLQDEAVAALTPRQREFLEDVLGSGRHLLSLINDILDLSKIEAGQMELSRQPLPPTEMVEEACQLMRAAMDKKQIVLRRKLASRRQVLADRGKGLQILLNLLSNAVKFSPPGSTIEVGCEAGEAEGEPGGLVRFWVRDQGMGIDDKLRARLFQPFTQGENALTKKYQGTGLGLAISKRLVEQHGGAIGVESSPGQGSLFWFTLPATAVSPITGQTEDGPPAPDPANGQAPGRALRVLVIDDDPAVGTLLRSMLERAGYAVSVAERAADGLLQARQQLPDALLVDLGLPDASGFSVIEELAADPRTRGRPIVVLTAQDLSEADRDRLRPHVVAMARKGDLVRAELLAKLDGALRPALAERAASRGRILVVDDHDLNRELVRSILERRGYEVLQAEDGEAGVTLAQRAQPDIILMDLAMPRKDGFAATRELKGASNTRAIPIVALTALAMRGDEEKARSAGVDAYLTKPVDRKRLEETVERLISGRRTLS